MIFLNTAKDNITDDKYRNLVEQASDGIVIVDHTLQYLEVNNMFCRMM